MSLRQGLRRNPGLILRSTCGSRHGLFLVVRTKLRGSQGSTYGNNFQKDGNHSSWYSISFRWLCTPVHGRKGREQRQWKEVWRTKGSLSCYQPPSILLMAASNWSHRILRKIPLNMDHSILKMISKSNKESASVHVHYLAHNLNFYLSLPKFSINLCTFKIHHLNHMKLKLKKLKTYSGSTYFSWRHTVHYLLN